MTAVSTRRYDRLRDKYAANVPTIDATFNNETGSCPGLEWYARRANCPCRSFHFWRIFPRKRSSRALPPFERLFMTDKILIRVILRSEANTLRILNQWAKHYTPLLHRVRFGLAWRLQGIFFNVCERAKVEKKLYHYTHGKHGNDRCRVEKLEKINNFKLAILTVAGYWKERNGYSTYKCIMQIWSQKLFRTRQNVSYIFILKTIPQAKFHISTSHAMFLNTRNFDKLISELYRFPI